MNNITIVNLRKKRCCTRVDRATVLGNPFIMRSEAERDEVCEKYVTYLHQQYRNANSAVYEAINKLVTELEQRDIVLGCWCAPKRCHAEAIRDLILTLSER